MQVKYFLTISFGLPTTSKIFHKEPFWAGSKLKPNSVIKNSSEMMNRGGSGWRGSEMETWIDSMSIIFPFGIFPHRSFAAEAFMVGRKLASARNWWLAGPARASLESWLVWLERSRESKRTGSGFDSVAILPFRYKSDCLPMYLWLGDALLLEEFFSKKT